MRLRIFVVGLLALMLFPVIASAGTRTETKSYVAGLDVLIANCDSPPGNVGGVCFSLQGDELTASLQIDDTAGWPVGALYDFRDASDASLSAAFFCGSVDNLSVPSAATRLLIFVGGPVLGPVDCINEASPGAGTLGDVTVTYETGVKPPPPPPIDGETDCVELVPHAAGVKGVTDPGQNINLDVAVLLDGVSETVAADAFAIAAERSYAALGITFRAVSYATVNFTGTDASGLNRQAKAHFGGQRPAGSDIVYTFTSKNMTDPILGDGVLGLADCIGGVEKADRAFAVGELLNSFKIGPTNWYLYGTAKVLAHEVGHLMGAHHHYANCVEGIPSEITEGEASACTVMSNFADFDSLNFSALNSAVVREHAVQFAAP